MNDFLKQLAERSKKNIPRNEGDYEKDGLLYCGKCHSPKQGKYFAEDGSYITPRILCDCEQEARNRKEEEVKREERIRYIDKLKRSGIQDRKLLNCSFEIDESPHSKYSKAFKRYCDKWEQISKDNIGLMLFGNVGTGKSFYAGCIANEIIKRYAIPVIVTSIPRILNEIFGLEDKNAYIKRLANIPLLVLDDFGVERETEYALEQVFAIIDERYKAEKPLIVTTNLNYDDFKNPTDIRYKRIYDRICEITVPFNITGASRREAKAEKKKQEAKTLLFVDNF